MLVIKSATNTETQILTISLTPKYDHKDLFIPNNLKLIAYIIKEIIKNSPISI